MGLTTSTARRLPNTELIRWYQGDLPQSDFHFSNHLKWKFDDPSDSFSPAKAYSEVFGVWWEIDLDTDGRFCLYLNDMRVGQLNYAYPSIAQVLAERAEDAARKDIFSYFKMIGVVEESRKLE